jgi:hypothetical protein
MSGLVNWSCREKGTKKPTLEIDLDFGQLFPSHSKVGFFLFLILVTFSKSPFIVYKRSLCSSFYWNL